MGSRVFIIGDSHTDAIRRALKKRGKANSKIQISALRFINAKGDKEIGDLTLEAAEREAATLSGKDLLVSTTGGNQHQVIGLVQHPIPFDFYEQGSGIPPLPSATIIPYQTLRAYLESGLRGRDGERITRLRKASNCRMVHVTPPPPKADEQHILRRFETAFAQKGITEHGVTPASVRLKLWRLQQSVMKGLSAEWNISLLPPPEGTQTPDGFLHPQYYADDATHGNTEYGELVLRQLENLVAN